MINKKKATTLLKAFKNNLENHPEKKFLFDEKQSFSFEKTYSLISSLSFQMTLNGISNDSSILILSERTVDYVLIFLATNFLGALSLIMDSRNDPDELIKQQDGLDKKVRFIVYSKDGHWYLKDRFKYKESELIFSYSKFYSYKERNGNKPSFVIFTSGTTGIPKGVVLSEHSIIKNTYATKVFGHYRKSDVSMVLIPFTHIFGIAQLIYAISLQHSVFVPLSLDIKDLLADIETYHVSRMNGVPSLYLALADEAKKEKRNLSSLNTGFIGGGPSTEQQVIAIEESLPIILIPVYGMSECLTITCTSFLDPTNKRQGTVGKAYKGAPVKIIDDNQNFAKPGVKGEIIVSSPYSALGYLDNKTVLKDEKGYIHTGDLGSLDEEGYLHIEGRKKDIIIRNGNNISSAKIEIALASLPFVKEAAVIAKPDSKEGEVPLAFVSLKNGKTADEVLPFIIGKLQKNELPKKIIALDFIPKTSSGKTDKIKLKKEYENQ